MTKPLVGILLGSKSDWDTMKPCAETLRDFGIPYEVRVASAHRTPEVVRDYCLSAEERGLKVLIGAAGMAAHLAGAMAAATHLPVLGVPMPSPLMHGLDALLSTVQMPGGIPVATFAVGKAGATNAALFTVAMLANEDTALRGKLLAHRKAMAEKISGDGDLKL